MGEHFGFEEVSYVNDDKEEDNVYYDSKNDLNYVKNCDFIWTMRFIQSDFQKMIPFQKVSFFPGSAFIGRKDLFQLEIKKFIRELENNNNNNNNNDTYNFIDISEGFGDFWPKGFDLYKSEELNEAKKEMKKTGKKLILKRPSSSDGRGVRIINSSSQLEGMEIENEFKQFKTIGQM